MARVPARAPPLFRLTWFPPVPDSWPLYVGTPLQGAIRSVAQSCSIWMGKRKNWHGSLSYHCHSFVRRAERNGAAVLSAASRDGGL